MILPFETYNPIWKNQFNTIRKQLETLLRPIHVTVDHIGSTSVEGLSAKPIIDIQLGVENDDDLDKIAFSLKLPNVVYYEKYNEDMPFRRFFVMFNQSTKEMGVASMVKLNEEIPEILHHHDLRIAHIHTFVKGSEDWVRHIAFRDYLRSHPKVKNAYQELKQDLIQSDWKDGNEYNEAKDVFLKRYERIALEWYKKSDYKHYENEKINLKEIAVQLAKPTTLNDYVAYGDVTAAIETMDGNVYTGISIDTACSLGHCAEHSAVAEMLKHGEYRIRAIVAVDSNGNAIPPCGRCRELISQLSEKNRKTVIEVSNGIFKTLEELMPFDWKTDTGLKW